MVAVCAVFWQDWASVAFSVSSRVLRLSFGIFLFVFRNHLTLSPKRALAISLSLLPDHPLLLLSLSVRRYIQVNHFSFTWVIVSINYRRQQHCETWTKIFTDHSVINLNTSLLCTAILLNPRSLAVLPIFSQKPERILSRYIFVFTCQLFHRLVIVFYVFLFRVLKLFACV